MHCRLLQMLAGKGGLGMLTCACLGGVDVVSRSHEVLFYQRHLSSLVVCLIGTAALLIVPRTDLSGMTFLFTAMLLCTVAFLLVTRGVVILNVGAR